MPWWPTACPPNAVMMVLDGVKLVGMPPGLQDAFGKSDLYLLRKIMFPSTLHKSSFLQWSETTSTFRKAWVSFLVIWLTDKVWKYGWSGTWLSSLWSRAWRLWKCFFLSDFPFEGLGSFWRPCLVFPFLSDFDKWQTFLQWFSFPHAPHFEP